jgi:phospholipase/lecithinase/hemolysin
LISAGAKHLMVVNLPSLGKLPKPSRDKAISDALKPSRDKAISDALNALTDAHNASLSTALQALDQSVGPDRSIMLFDIGALFKQVLADPQKFGFTNVTDAEMEMLANLRGYTEKFFFWDGVHPTTIAHLLLAKTAVSLLTAKTAALV